MGRQRKTYSPEFKKKVLSELLYGKSVSDACTEYGLAPSTLSEWKATFRKDGLDCTNAKVRKAMEALKEENRTLKTLLGKKELEIELLKKEECF